MKIGYTSNNHSYAILGTNSGQSPFLTKMNKKSINSRNDNINKMRSSNTQVNKANPLSNIIIPNEQNLFKSRNCVFNQIKTSAHVKTNSDNFFNIPCYAYGTDNKKMKEKNKDKQSDGKTKKRQIEKNLSEHGAYCMQKIDSHLKSLKTNDNQLNYNEFKVNPLHAIIAKKLYNEMLTSAHTNIIPGNNSSGTSTQGSSTNDFKSSAKKRKQQQECYYKTTINKHDALSIVQNESHQENQQNRKGHALQLESINPNIFIVEENKHSEFEDFNSYKRKARCNQLNLHEYCADNSNEIFKQTSQTQQNENNEYSQHTKAFKTIESEDRNQYDSSINNLLFENEEISRIEPDFSNVYEVPQHETQKDLENLLQILNKVDN